MKNNGKNYKISICLNEIYFYFFKLESRQEGEDFKVGICACTFVYEGLAREV